MEISKSPFAADPLRVTSQPIGREQPVGRRRFEEELATPARGDETPSRQELIERYRPDDAGREEPSTDYGEMIRRARLQAASEAAREVNGEPPPPASRRAINAYLSQAQEAYGPEELMPRIDRYV